MPVVWNKESLLISYLLKIFIFQNNDTGYYNLPVGRYEFLGDPTDTKV